MPSETTLLLQATSQVLGLGDLILKSTPVDALGTFSLENVYKCGNSLRSITILAEAKMADDAICLARTIFESAIQLRYLHAQPDEFSDYRDFLHVKRYQYYKDLKCHSPQHLESWEPSTIEKTIAEFDRVEQRFRTKSGHRTAWSRKSLREMSKAVGLELQYVTMYKTQSSLVHGDALGYRMISVSESSVTKSCTLALSSGAFCYLLVLDACNEFLKLPYDSEIAAGLSKLEAVR